jgi:hypothetical protein
MTEGQVPIFQDVGAPRLGARRDPAHRAVRTGKGGARCRGLLILGGFLALGLAAPLRAQGRGELQIGAQVLRSAPSQSALALALQSPVGTARSELAEIGHQPLAAGSDSAGVALPPRSVVTIAFLRN